MSVAAALQRGFVSVSGKDAVSFIQGLISCDVLKQPIESAKAGLFLNNKGRIIADVFVYKKSAEEILLDCDGPMANDLTAMLKKFVLRKKAVVENKSDLYEAFAVFRKGKDESNGKQIVSFTDGRPSSQGGASLLLGERVWNVKGTSNFQTLLSKSDYDLLRIANGIAEGVEEVSNELPFVLNFDKMDNYLCYEKGCYIGQELIARTHFKGQVRNRTFPFFVTSEDKTPAEGLEVFRKYDLSFPKKNIYKNHVSQMKKGDKIVSTSSSGSEGTVLAMAGDYSVGLVSIRDFTPQSKNDFTFKEKYKLDVLIPSWHGKKDNE